MVDALTPIRPAAPIRPATTADRDEIVRLGGLMYESVGDMLTEEWRERVLADIDRRLGVDLWGWVIDGEGGRLAACALLDRHPRLARPGEDASWRAYVQWVYTDHGYRRRGYARALMTTILRWSAEQGVKVVELHSSQNGLALYEGLGFTPPRGTALHLDLQDADLS